MKFFFLNFFFFLITRLFSFEACLSLNEITYSKCLSLRNCNICSLSIYCGWCLSSQRCLPLSIPQNKPLCGENCDQILEISHCFRASTRKFSEEIDLSATPYNRPQFQPGKHEKTRFLSRKPRKNAVFSQKTKEAVNLQSAKREILDFFEKLSKKTL